jgi:hypothetical protein
MKNIRFVIFFYSLLISTVCFSQTDCGNNAGFETGTTAGWVCKSGWYGTGPCPMQDSGVCPTFNTVLNTVAGCININGIDAALNTGVDRHTIMDTNAYGTGIDPNSASPYIIHVVDSGGGKYSFRLGDGVTKGTKDSAGYTGTCLGAGCYARSEAIRFTFNVTAQNAFYTYRYAAFLQDPGHAPEEQPRFEVIITLPDLNDSVIAGGYHKLVVSGLNPTCTGPGNFHQVGSWKYTDWTDVSNNLTNYIGQNIAVEFRTSDCFPGNQPTTIINGNCTTTCQNGVCCTTGNACLDTCIGTLTCNNQPGNHSAYAYIDAYCSAITGINELNNNAAIRIYPNPMTSSCIIEIIGTKSSEVVIFDMLGKELIRRKLTANKTEIQKGDLEPGIYFVRVNEYVKKLIVE